MKQIVLATIMLAAATTAPAAGIYVASGNAQYYIAGLFEGLGGQPGTTPFSGTCSVGGAGNFGCTSVAFSFVNGAARWTYTDGNWSGLVGGDAIAHTGNCTQESVTACGDLLGPIWNNSQTNVGDPTGQCTAWPGPFFAAGNCDRASIVEVPGVSLQIIEQSRSPISVIPGSVAGYVYTFTAAPVPVPPAVWLFGSALGLLGWARRKAD